MNLNLCDIYVKKYCFSCDNLYPWYCRMAKFLILVVRVNRVSILKAQSKQAYMDVVWMLRF